MAFPASMSTSAWRIMVIVPTSAIILSAHIAVLASEALSSALITGHASMWTNVRTTYTTARTYALTPKEPTSAPVPTASCSASTSSTATILTSVSIRPVSTAPATTRSDHSTVSAEPDMS